MRRPETTLASILLASVLATASAADTTNAQILGTWKTPKHDGKVVIEECGAAICGRVIDGRELRANPNQTDVRNPNVSKRERKILGLNILEGYTGGPTAWTGGTVYDPQTGDSSSDSTLTLQSPNTLVVKGCRLVFCRSETWTKIASAGG
jgi:uncharacterized protein (DUF2147 family)